MKKTVSELIKMINHQKGILHVDHSTQRDFIYNNETVMCVDGEVTKAGNVIKSILEHKIQLPALYFWNVQDDIRGVHYKENEYNMHDGKQRILSIYYFIFPDISNPEHKVITRINGVEKSFKDLTVAQQKALLDYEIDIVVRAGTMEEEETSFIILNDNITPLTDYEKLKGAFHGILFDTFEKYINSKALIYDSIKMVGRGHQAQYFLYMALGLIEEDRKTLFKKAQDVLTHSRLAEFDYTSTKMDVKLKLYNDLAKMGVIKTNNMNKDPEKLCRVVNYIIEKNYDPEVVVAYYKESQNFANDVGRWTVDVHKTAINALFNGIKCDYRRFWLEEERATLWISSSSRECAICGNILDKYNDEVEVDHKIPWSKGGRTELVNAQLVHKKCNLTKGCKL